MQYRSYIENTPASTALVEWIESIYDGWDVNFTPFSWEDSEESGSENAPLSEESLDNSGLGVRRLSVRASQLVVGIIRQIIYPLGLMNIIPFNLSTNTPSLNPSTSIIR